MLGVCQFLNYHPRGLLSYVSTAVASSTVAITVVLVQVTTTVLNFGLANVKGLQKSSSSYLPAMTVVSVTGQYYRSGKSVTAAFEESTN